MTADELTRQRDDLQSLIKNFESSIAGLEATVAEKEAAIAESRVCIAEKEALLRRNDAVADEAIGRLQVHVDAADQRYRPRLGRAGVVIRCRERERRVSASQILRFGYLGR